MSKRLIVTVDLIARIDSRLLAGGVGNTQTEIARDEGITLPTIERRSRYLRGKGIDLPPAVSATAPDKQKTQVGQAVLQHRRLHSANINETYARPKVDLKLYKPREEKPRVHPSPAPMPWADPQTDEGRKRLMGSR